LVSCFNFFFFPDCPTFSLMKNSFIRVLCVCALVERVVSSLIRFFLSLTG
jgi:hypothetical protein